MVWHWQTSQPLTSSPRAHSGWCEVIPPADATPSAFPWTTYWKNLQPSPDAVCAPVWCWKPRIEQGKHHRCPSQSAGWSRVKLHHRRRSIFWPDYPHKEDEGRMWLLIFLAFIPLVVSFSGDARQPTLAVHSQHFIPNGPRRRLNTAIKKGECWQNFLRRVCGFWREILKEEAESRHDG